EIDSICKVLFNSKIHEVIGIKRSPITSDETAGTDDFLTTKPQTNDWTVVMPYDVTFKGFSGDLANVLDGLIKASNCVVVRDIVVKQADAQTGEETTAMPVYTMPIPSQGPGSAMNRYRMSPEMMRRYGLGGMRGMQPTPATPPPPTTRGPGVLQDEHLL